MPASSRVAPGLLSVGFVLLAVAWAFSNPPGSAPDEPAHYIRAVSVGRFHWLGQHTTQTVMRAQNDRQLKFLHSITRMVPVPSDLAAPDVWYCTVIDHDTSAVCLDRSFTAAHPSVQPTYVGAYAPFAYLPVGLATRLGTDPVSALLWARLASAVIALALILTAVGLVWDTSGPTSVLGVVLAVTPMVIFTSVVVSTSSAEVAASLCLAAAAIRLWRNPRSRAGAYSAGVSAFILGVARPLGPVWVFFGAILVGTLLRREGLLLLVRGAWRRTIALVGFVLFGIAINVAWQLRVLPPGPRPLDDVLGFIGPSIGTLPEAFGEAIGFFGWQDVLMPRPAYAAWSLAFVMLLASALMTGRRRELRAMENLLGLAVIVVIVISAAAVMPTGYPVRGRYILPALMAVCLVAGEIVHRNRRQVTRSRLRTLVVGITSVAAALQFVGWYSMAHRYAVGTNGPWLFLGRAMWEPPLGWVTWLVVVALGSLCVGAGAIRAGAPNAEIQSA